MTTNKGPILTKPPLVFDKEDRSPEFARYREQWEAGILAAVASEMASLSDQERAELARSWVLSSYNGAAFGVYDRGEDWNAAMEWQQTGPTHYDLIYTGPYGIKCSLGRVYEQPNGTWASLVIAGCKDDMPEAMAAAEWAIARLST